MNRFVDVLENNLNLQLHNFTHKALTKETYEEIYQIIFETLFKVFTKETQFKLEVNAIQYLTNEYFKCVCIDDSVNSPKTSLEEYSIKLKNTNLEDAISLSEISKENLQTICFIFSDTDFVDDVKKELESRT